MPGPAGFILMLSVLLLAGSAASIMTSIALASVIPNELRGTSLCVFGVLNGLAGFGIAPTLVPVISKLLGRGNDLGMALVIVTVLVNIASIFGFLLAALRLKKVQSYLVSNSHESA
jgi:hypothetical protein